MRRLLQIADLFLAIESDGLPWDFTGTPHQRFEVGQGDADARTKVHWHSVPRQKLGEEIWTITNVSSELPPTCRLYRDREGLWSIHVHDLPSTPFRQRVAVFGPDFAEGDLYVELREPKPPSPLRYPACPPLDRAWFVHLLAQGGGILLHACGVVHEGSGYLFAGRSGAGKTTLARLWLADPNATVLGEESLALRRKGSQFWMYGTPWIGESGAFSPAGAPLRGIYFISHASDHFLQPLPMERAVERLLAHSFLPTYDPAVASRGLDFCLDLVQEVPAYLFGFRPDASAVQFMGERGGRERAP